MTPEQRANIAYRATTGLDEDWAGCAHRETVERVSTALAEAERRGYQEACEELLTDGTPGRRDIPRWLVPVLSDMIEARNLPRIAQDQP